MEISEVSQRVLSAEAVHLLDLHNSCDDTQPHSIIVKYLSVANYPTDNPSLV